MDSNDGNPQPSDVVMPEKPKTDSSDSDTTMPTDHSSVDEASSHDSETSHADASAVSSPLAGDDSAPEADSSKNNNDTHPAHEEPEHAAPTGDSSDSNLAHHEEAATPFKPAEHEDEHDSKPPAPTEHPPRPDHEPASHSDVEVAQHTPAMPEPESHVEHTKNVERKPETTPSMAATTPVTKPMTAHPPAASHENPVHHGKTPDMHHDANQAGHHTHIAKSKKPMMAIGLGAALLIALGLAGFFGVSNSQAQSKVEDLEAEVAELNNHYHELPEGSIKVSECVPNMGFHYIAKDGDPRFGPYYLVSKQGKLIGYEYMFSDDMFTSVPELTDLAGFEIALLLTQEPIHLSNWQYNTIEFSRSPSGHEGFEQPHTDVHLYTVTTEEQARSCQ